MPKFVNKWGESTPVGPSVPIKPKNKLSWHTMTGGANNEDEKYKQKYLIYKNKYLKLKNMIQ